MGLVQIFGREFWNGRVAIRFIGIHMSKDAELVHAVQKLYEWQYMQRSENDFTHQLYSSLQKANDSEFDRLKTAFPFEAAAYREWLRAPDPVEFFSSYGVWKGPRR